MRFTRWGTRKIAKFVSDYNMQQLGLMEDISAGNRVVNQLVTRGHHIAADLEDSLAFLHLETSSLWEYEPFPFKVWKSRDAHAPNFSKLLIFWLSQFTSRGWYYYLQTHPTATNAQVSSNSQFIHCWEENKLGWVEYPDPLSLFQFLGSPKIDPKKPVIPQLFGDPLSRRTSSSTFTRNSARTFVEHHSKKRRPFREFHW